MQLREKTSELINLIIKSLSVFIISIKISPNFTVDVVASLHFYVNEEDYIYRYICECVCVCVCVCVGMMKKTRDNRADHYTKHKLLHKH